MFCPLFDLKVTSYLYKKNALSLLSYLKAVPFAFQVLFNLHSFRGGLLSTLLHTKKLLRVTETLAPFLSFFPHTLFFGSSSIIPAINST